MIPRHGGYDKPAFSLEGAMERREYILYHQKRLAAQAAGEPFAKALIEIYNNEIPTLRIYPDGHLECIYPSQNEIEKIRLQWAAAVKNAVYLIEHGFNYL